MAENAQIVHEIDGVRVPNFFYGTAWKEDATRALTSQAIELGFRAIDTANQRKHYNEAEVGQAVADAIESGAVTREQLFIQTKFTLRRGQDQRLPYDPRAPIRDQVQQSTASSIEHLKISRLDSLVLHGPSFGRGLVPDDWEAWRAMEDAHDRAQTRFLGISNVAIDQLESLVREARVKPAFVQNRCYAAQGWDRGIREFCKQHGVLYQGFSLLTANRDALGHSTVIRIAAARGWSPAQVVFRFALDIGMIALTGTTSAEHMSADLAVLDAPSLDQAEIDQIERIDKRR